MHQDINDTIADNLGLVYKQLNRFNLRNDQDAESFAYEALYSAALTFKADRQVTFSTYATVCIYNALGNYIRTKNKQRQLLCVSYNELTKGGDEYIDFLCDPMTVEDQYIATETRQFVMRTFLEEYNALKSETHKKIVTVWYSAGFDITTKEIASEVNVSQSYVSQSLNVFRYKIRQKVEAFMNGQGC